MSRKIQLNSALTLAIALRNSLTEKLDAAGAKVAALTNQLANLDAIEALGVGSEVVIKVGRGETRQEVVGVIKAVKAGEVTMVEATEEAEAYEVVGDRTFKVEFSRSGDSFDSEFAIVAESAVSLPVTDEAEEEEAAAE